MLPQQISERFASFEQKLADLQAAIQPLLISERRTTRSASRFETHKNSPYSALANIAAGLVAELREFKDSVLQSAVHVAADQDAEGESDHEEVSCN
jgi:hypothetical protein